MKKFEWRKLFPISYYRWNKGHDFNIVVFYADLFIWASIISVLLVILIVNFLE